MTKCTLNLKAKFLASAGCVVVSLALSGPSVAGGGSEKWYESIEMPGAPLFKAYMQTAARDKDGQLITFKAAKDSQLETGSSIEPGAPLYEAYRLTAVRNDDGKLVAFKPVAESARQATQAAGQAPVKTTSSIEPGAPLYDAYRQTAVRSNTGKLIAFKPADELPPVRRTLIEPGTALYNAYQNTAVPSADGKLMVFKPSESSPYEVADKSVYTGKISTQNARASSNSMVDPASDVTITPVASYAGDNEDDGAGDAWYSSFWPIGHRVGINKLKDEYVPFQTNFSDEEAAKKGLNTLPDRPQLLIEAGDGFLDTGNLDEGFEVPLIGAIWQPRLWGYLISRTAVQSFNNGSPNSQRETEIATRLDAFFNLQLTGTEKVLLGLRPVDKNRFSDFTKYTISGREEGLDIDYRLGLETLFFEGDLGSLFPVFDKEGIIPLDFGFTVGRQPLVIQEGILINDTIDAVGLIRNNIPVPGTSNFRVSGMYGWNRTDRNDGKSGDEEFFGLFTAADMHRSTVNLDLIYIKDGEVSGDGLYAGLSSIQRIPELGGISTAFRVNASYAVTKDRDRNSSRLGTGVLFTSEISKTVHGSSDIVYFNSFLGLGNFTQAGREAIVGGPLANTGILFASASLSLYGAEINPFIPDDVIGGAIGYQAFWDDHRRNLVLEIAGRHDLEGESFDTLGFGFQLQQAVGQHVQLQLEGFYTLNSERQDGSGGRAEILFVL